MKISIFATGVLLCLCCALPAQNYYYTLREPAPDTYTLTDSSQVSAGVYDKASRLLRTLFSNRKQAPGTYPRPTWDGLNDFGQPLPGGGYDIKVLTNRVRYAWEGAAVGNTSSDRTGAGRHRGLMGFFRFTVVGDRFYYTNAYGEQQASTFQGRVGEPQSRNTVFGKGGTARYVCSDGQRVFWSSYDPHAKKSFVFVTSVADNEEYVYPAAVPLRVTHARRHRSALAVRNGSVSEISGLAVNDGLLFISRERLGEIEVLDLKQGGRQVNLVRMNSPREITAAGSKQLWILSGQNQLAHYRVRSDGSLTRSRVVSGLEDPLTMALSPDGNTLAVADAGSYQQIRFFDAQRLTEGTALGQRGGYANGPRVSTDKLYLTDNRSRNFDSGGWGRQRNHASLSYGTDGSLWVLDVGNNRILHYDADLNFQDQIQYVPDWLSLGVDKNNSSRLFSDLLEYRIDYDLPAAEGWELVNNWGYAIDDDHYDPFVNLVEVATFKNGQTYAHLRKGRALSWVRLDPDLGLVFGPRVPGSLNARLAANGDILDTKPTHPGEDAVWRRFNFRDIGPAGFPRHDGPVEIARRDANLPSDPVMRWGARSTIAFLDEERLVSFDARPEEQGSGSGYHLGVLNTVTNEWLARTALATGADYRGDYPLDGRFDTGNDVHNAGSVALTAAGQIIWGYYGEFWKGGFQTNQYAHYHESGLLVSVFGTNWIQNPNGTQYDGRGNGPALIPFAGQAGNALNPQLVPHPTDKDVLYLFHPDESWHGGVHRWKISGLSTIRNFILPVTQEE